MAKKKTGDEYPTRGEQVVQRSEDLRLGGALKPEEKARAAYRNDVRIERSLGQNPTMEDMKNASTKFTSGSDSSVSYRRLQQTRAEEDKNYPGRVERTKKLSTHDMNDDVPHPMTKRGETR